MEFAHVNPLAFMRSLKKVASEMPFLKTWVCWIIRITHSIRVIPKNVTPDINVQSSLLKLGTVNIDLTGESMFFLGLYT